jgi:hypothetical protein
VQQQLSVVVGAAAAGQVPAVVAAPVGVRTLALPSVGLVVVPPTSTEALTLRLLPQPAAMPTAVTIVSSAPDVVTATADGGIAAGSQTAQVTLTTLNAGQAVLTFQAGAVQQQLSVVVGAAAAGQVPAVVAAPVGVCLGLPPEACP